MENISSCPSCDGFSKTRRVNVLGKVLELKNYNCARDGGEYTLKPQKVKLQLTVCPTSFCSARCPFCIAKNTDKKQFLDIEKLKNTLYRLKEEDVVRGVSFSGGEPMTDFDLFNKCIKAVFEVLGLDTEISVTTNGINLHRLNEIEYLSYIDAIHISRHHYDESINQSIFGVALPTNQQLTDIMHSVAFRDIFVLNCMLLKEHISTPYEAHKYLDFAIKAGAKKVSFITCAPINEYAKARILDYTEVLKEDDPDLLFTRGYRDFDYCRCQDGVYVSPEGGMIEFYGRSTDVSDCKYCRGFVYGSDNRLRVGFGGEVII